MALNDPIADMLTTIRNGQTVKLVSVKCPASKMRKSVLEVLKKEGYIIGFSEQELRKGVSELTISLKYYEGKPVIRHIKKVSKPGCREYSSISSSKKVYNGLGIAILSTSKGIMTDYDARQANVGGEVLCNVF